MKPRAKAALWAGLPLLLLAPPMVWIGIEFAGQVTSEQRIRTQHTLEIHASSVQRSIDRIEDKLESLEIFVVGQTAGGKELDDRQFATFAAGLHASSKWIRAFQVVSDGVITHTFPLQGNEAALGYNLLNDPRPVIGGDVIRAEKTGHITVTGPLDLVQGGQGIIIRKPLPRIHDPHTRLVAIVLNLAPLLAESDLRERTADDIQLAIRRGANEVFFGSPAVFDRQPVTQRLSLPDGFWEMGACPREGWQASVSGPVLRFNLAGGTIIALLCVLVFVLAHSRANLAVTVGERTEALRNELAARQQAQEQLRQNYSLLQAVTEGTSDVVFAKDREGRYQMINSAGAGFIGKPPEVIVGRTDLELFSAETARSIMAGDRKVIESGVLQTVEEEMTGPRGSRISQATKAPWRDKQGRTIGVVGVSRDITERKRMEAAFTESERQLSLILNNVSDTIFALAVEPNGGFRFTSVNRRFLEATGLAENQVVGRAAAAVIPEAVQALVFGKYREAIQSRQPVRWEEVSDYPAGRKIGQVTVVPVFDAQGTCRQLVGMVHDITERKQSEDRLAESERKYRVLVEHANSIILRWSSEGRITFLNEFGQRFFGYSAEEAIGRPVVGTIVPLTESDGRDLPRLIEQIRADPEAYEQNVNENIRRNGQRVWVAWTNRIVRDDLGQVAEILSIGTDITERRRAEAAVRELNATLEHRVAERTAELAVAKERAESADRVKSSFLATMSHELRTPLNSIIGFTGIILQGLAGPLNAEQGKQLEIVRSSARHLLALINDVLDISKIEAAQLAVVCEPMEVRAAVEKVAGIVRPLAERKGLVLRVELAPEVGAVVSDQRRVEQVLLNLLNNAVKFTERGEIVLTADIPDATSSTGGGDRRLRLAVRDTGIGIKPEDLATLFQPFRQIDSGLTRQHEGTGLGLAICRRLAELMGGEINVKGQWGVGSEFVFTLPVKESNC